MYSCFLCVHTNLSFFFTFLSFSFFFYESHFFLTAEAESM